MALRIKERISKRIEPIPLIMYQLRKDRKGFRKIKTAKNIAEHLPINCNGADHVHIYMSLKCNLNCDFCINRLVTDGKLPKFKEHTFLEWSTFLNRLYNLREINFNGGEHFIRPDFTDLINSLDNFNIIIFTNLPRKGIEQIKRLRRGNNNIILKISYHPLQDEPINMFIERYRQVPKEILKHVHLIKVNGVSTQMYKDRLAREGIYATSNELVLPLNKDKTPKIVECNTHEHIVGPDMKMYRCVSHMLHQWGSSEINDYSFNYEYIKCPFFPKYNICSAYNNIRWVKNEPA